MILDKWPTWNTVLFCVFISIPYMFRATSCSSSGESIVSKQHLVYVTLCWWLFRVQVGKEIYDLHTKRSPTQSDIYQMLLWYNWFSWWWARGCSKHVENWNKYVEKNCASIWSFTKNTYITNAYIFNWMRNIITTLRTSLVLEHWRFAVAKLKAYHGTRCWWEQLAMLVTVFFVPHFHLRSVSSEPLLLKLWAKVRQNMW
jgi:hypothetical protein